MSNLFTSIFVLVSILASTAHASDSIPRAKTLFSNDARITMNYSTLEESFAPPSSSYRNITLKSSPLFISIQKNALSARDRVHYMLIQYQQACFRGICHDAQSIEEGDLVFAFPGQFEGYSHFPITLYSQVGQGSDQQIFRSARQEIVIWINGQIFKDTRSGHNLSFDLAQF